MKRDIATTVCWSAGLTLLSCGLALPLTETAPIYEPLPTLSHEPKAELEEWFAQRQATLPPATGLVTIKDIYYYHWNQECPRLHVPLSPRQKPAIMFTRQQAEAHKILPCGHCVDLTLRQHGLQ